MDAEPPDRGGAAGGCGGCGCDAAAGGDSAERADDGDCCEAAEDSCCAPAASAASSAAADVRQVTPAAAATERQMALWHRLVREQRVDELREQLSGLNISSMPHPTFKNELVGGALLIAASSLNCVGVIRLLVEELGVSPRYQATCYTGPMTAAANGALEALQYYMTECKVDHNETCKREWCGGNFLHFAAANGRAEVVRFLLQHDGDFDAQDASGLTPLHHAAMANFTDVIELLLDARASPDISDDTNKTPLELAAWAGASNSVRTLCARAEHLGTLGKERKIAFDENVTPENKVAVAKTLVTARKRLAMYTLIRGMVPGPRPPPIIVPSITPSAVPSLSSLDDGVLCYASTASAVSSISRPSSPCHSVCRQSSPSVSSSYGSPPPSSRSSCSGPSNYNSGLTYQQLVLHAQYPQSPTPPTLAQPNYFPTMASSPPLTGMLPVPPPVRMRPRSSRRLSVSSSDSDAGDDRGSGVPFPLSPSALVDPLQALALSPPPPPPSPTGVGTRSLGRGRQPLMASLASRFPPPHS